MKIATIEAHSFNCLAGHMVITGRGRGSSAKVAARRAFESIFNYHGLNGRRIKTFRATIVISEAVEEKKEGEAK